MSFDLPARPTALPTLDLLNAEVPSDLAVDLVASIWLEKLSHVLSTRDFAKLDDLLLPAATWKDILALTWDFRSIRSLPSIRTMLFSQVASQGFSVRPLTSEEHLEAQGIFEPVLSRPFPDVAWIQFGFVAETKVGSGISVARLVPTANGAWLAWTVFTSLDKLQDFPERVSSSRFEGPDFNWVQRRAREKEFVDTQPTVVVIGAGHIGLQVAARLQYLEVATLVLEKLPRVGDIWRERYDRLCLHDPLWFNQLAYLPFPTTWPKYPPGKKIGSWLESYAENLDLNVWTSASTTSIVWNKTTKDWTVNVTRSDGTQRVLTPKYVVFAHGTGGGVPNIPHIAGQEAFKGIVIHSEDFKSGQEFQGKKAVVVGACNSGHDVAHDLYDYGADVTMFQRSTTYVISAKALAMQLKASHYVENGPPTEVADRLGASIPPFAVRLLQGRAAQRIADTVDKELHDNLRKVGFGLSLGVDGGGIISLLTTRRGGFYMNVGTSQLISDGRIKLKHGGAISRFSSNGLYFDDGTHLDAEVVVFATGYGDARDLAHELCEHEVVDKVGEVWGIDEEGELKGVWRDSGHPHLFFAQGNFVLARQYSAYLALQIKASEEGLMSARYTIHKQYGQGT